MPRPFAVVGITFFVTLSFLSFVSEKVLIYTLAISLIGLVPVFAFNRFKNPSVIPTAWLTVVLACIVLLSANELFYKPAIEYSGKTSIITGVITDNPKRENGRYYYNIVTEKINNDPMKMKLRFSSALPIDAKLYDRITAKATTYILGENNEDSLRNYKTSGMFLGAFLVDELIIVESDIRKPLMFHIMTLKQQLTNNICELLPNENGGLIIALLFGNKSYLSEKTIINLREIGISHIMAVSGLHLSIFLLVIINTLETIKLNKRLSYFLVAIFVLLFMALAGFSASVLRAGFMFLVVILGKLINREADSINSLGLAVLIITIVNPFSAGYIGLQLSFFATLGILTSRGKIVKLLKNKTKNVDNRLVNYITNIVLETVAMTVAASIFTFPILLIYFHRISLVSVLSNLILVFGATSAMIIGSVAAILFMVPGLSVFAYPSSLIAGLFAKAVLKISDILARIPFASINLSSEHYYIWLSFSLIIFAVSLVLYKMKGKAYFKLTAIICSFALTAVITGERFININTTKITVVDSGNASSIVLSYKHSAAIIGCGGDEYSAKKIIKVLENTNTRSIDLMLIPRAAQTESGALKGLLDKYNPEHIIIPQHTSELSFLKKRENIEIENNTQHELWPGTTIEYLYSDNTSCAYANISGTDILFLFLPGSDLSGIPKSWKNAEILVCRSKPPTGLDITGFHTIILSTDIPLLPMKAAELKEHGIKLYTTVTNGNITVKIKDNSMFSTKGEKS
jgi:competence protein ComEC